MSSKEVMFLSLFVCFSVGDSAQKLPNGFAQNFQGKTDSPDGRTDIVTLVRRALAEVCSVPVLLVSFYNDFTNCKL